MAVRRRPILVTGVPRSGTTWLARQLASASGSALTGREPMNAHGRQYALGGTIQAWARIVEPTPEQLRAMRRAYSGLAPRVYGRYGHRQWAAPLPTTRIVVKDPFAVLSVGALHEATSALPVLVYRHPGAVLASYRRMGWSPDLAEIEAAVPPADQVGREGHDLAQDPVAAMAWFWATLNHVALSDITRTGSGVVVSHSELAAGGPAAMQRLYRACGLGWDGRTEAAVRSAGSGEGRAPKARVNSKGKTLHELSRDSTQVAEAWRSKISPDELTVLEQLAGPTLHALEAARIDLG
jgi:hypothetical protein